MEKIILEIQKDLRTQFSDFKWAERDLIYKIEENTVSKLMNDLKLIENYLNYFLNKDLSEEVLDDIYRMTQLITWNEPLAALCSEKDRNINYAIQFVFSIYLRFGVPLKLWQDVADQSWILLKKYYAGAYANFESFKKENQQQWAACCNKLEEFREHPEYGDKIKAKDSGYV